MGTILEAYTNKLNVNVHNLILYLYKLIGQTSATVPISNLAPFEN